MDDKNTKQGDELFRGAIRWDDLTIQGEAVAFPPDLRPDYIWLKSFTRDALARDLDLLTERFKAVGVFRDKGTWSKILRGLWARDAKGAPRATPVISAENFATDVEALRTNTRAEALRGRVPFVMTSTAKEIFRYIDMKRDPARVNQFGVIVGPTGAQKTATYKEYTRQRNHGSTRWFEAPENGALVEFVTRLAHDMSAQTAQDKKRAHLLKSLKPGMCVIIDNVQDLYRSEWGDRQPAFSFLRRLQDETGCAIILSITPTFERQLVGKMMSGYFEQFEGRSGGSKRWLRLPEFAPDEDVLAIAQAFELREAKKHLKELVAISREPGRIRRLFEDLQDARILAGKDPLTMEHVREAREEA